MAWALPRLLRRVGAALVHTQYALPLGGCPGVVTIHDLSFERDATLMRRKDRLVFRTDLAFPLKRGPFPETGIPTQVDPVGFFFSFGQAFGP